MLLDLARLLGQRRNAVTAVPTVPDPVTEQIDEDIASFLAGDSDGYTDPCAGEDPPFDPPWRD